MGIIYVNIDHGKNDPKCTKCIVIFNNGEKKTGWIAHWMIKTGKKYGKCSMIIKGKNGLWKKCHREADRGAHIRKKNVRSNNKQYIVPACRSCNAFKSYNQDFKLKEGAEYQRIRALQKDCYGTMNLPFSIKTDNTKTRRKSDKNYKKSTKVRSRLKNKRKSKKKIGTKSNPYRTKSEAKKGRKKGIVWYYYYGNSKKKRSMKK